jgi:hypothetical protein
LLERLNGKSQSQNLSASSIDSQMQLPPRPSFTYPMCANFPFSFTIHMGCLSTQNSALLTQHSRLNGKSQSQNLSASSIDSQMQLPPRPSFTYPMCANFPFSFTIHMGCLSTQNSALLTQHSSLLIDIYFNSFNNTNIRLCWINFSKFETC